MKIHTATLLAEPKLIHESATIDSNLLRDSSIVWFQVSDKPHSWELEGLEDQKQLVVLWSKYWVPLWCNDAKCKDKKIVLLKVDNVMQEKAWVSQNLRDVKGFVMITHFMTVLFPSLAPLAVPSLTS